MSNLKTLSKEQLELILHNMRIYGVSNEKRQSVIDELNRRHKQNTDK
jgi:phosphoribosyl-ATP pyrophosphohydrolase